MSEPFDLDALAVEEESAEPFRFTWAGAVYTMPTLAQLTWADSRAFWATDDGTARMRILLGDHKYEQLIATPVSAARMLALIDAYHRHQGVTEGESEASTGS